MSYDEWHATTDGGPSPTARQVWAEAVKHRTLEIVALIRAEADDNKGKAWFHADSSLTALADRIQGTT